MSVTPSDAALRDACASGNLAQLRQWDAAGVLPTASELDDFYNFPHEYAVQHGHLAVLRWLVLESSHCIDLTNDADTSFSTAAQYGHLEILKWLAFESGQSFAFMEHLEEALGEAIQNNQLPVVQWIIQELKQPALLSTTTASIALRSAASQGHLEMIAWIIRDSGQLIDVTEFDNAMLLRAAKNGHVDLVCWLLLHSGQHEELCRNAANWLRFLAEDEQQQVAVLCYGIDPAAYQDAVMLYSVLSCSQVKPKLAVLTQLCNEAGLSEGWRVRKMYFCNAVVQTALDQSLVTTMEDLEKLCILEVSVTRRVGRRL